MKSIQCLKCGASLDVSAFKPGTKIKCPKCKNINQVPRESAPPPSDAAPRTAREVVKKGGSPRKRILKKTKRRIHTAPDVNHDEEAGAREPDTDAEYDELLDDGKKIKTYREVTKKSSIFFPVLIVLIAAAAVFAAWFTLYYQPAQNRKYVQPLKKDTPSEKKSGDAKAEDEKKSAAENTENSAEEKEGDPEPETTEKIAVSEDKTDAEATAPPEKKEPADKEAAPSEKEETADNEPEKTEADQQKAEPPEKTTDDGKKETTAEAPDEKKPDPYDKPAAIPKAKPPAMRYLTPPPPHEDPEADKQKNNPQEQEGEPDNEKKEEAEEG